MVASFVCEQCRVPFPATRRDARYCSAACRSAARHERRKLEADLGASAIATLAILDRVTEPTR